MFNVKNKMNDLGVSPVIGVILMVAVTVILAAVIGSFVLGLGSNVEQNPQAGVTFSESSDTVTVQVISASNVDELRVEATGASGNATLSTDVGSTATVSNSGTGDLTTGVAQSGTVTVVGDLDGTESVIQTYEYDFS